MSITKPLTEQKILIFAGEAYEDLELWYSKLRLEEAGVHVTLAGLEAGRTYPGKHGYPCQTDAAIADTVSTDFDGVVCAGGWMPDKLRRDPKVLQLLKEFEADQKLIAAICHGGWMPISADIYRGVKTTGSPGIKDDLINAGAEWIDAEVVRDGHHVTSRRPSDLPAFCREILNVLTGSNS